MSDMRAERRGAGGGRGGGGGEFGCGRGHGEHRGRPARLAGRGSSLLGPGAARGGQWERPIADLGVHHMAWPANMHCRGDRHRAPPQASCVKSKSSTDWLSRRA